MKLAAGYQYMCATASLKFKECHDKHDENTISLQHLGGIAAKEPFWKDARWRFSRGTLKESLTLAPMALNTLVHPNSTQSMSQSNLRLELNT